MERGILVKQQQKNNKSDSTCSRLKNLYVCIIVKIIVII